MKTTDKTLTFTESKISEPLTIPVELVKKYINNDKIIVNGVVTHLMLNCSEEFHNFDEIKYSITMCLEHINANEDMDKFRTNIDGTHIIEVKKVSDNYVFDYIKVTPVYV